MKQKLSLIAMTVIAALVMVGVVGAQSEPPRHPQRGIGLLTDVVQIVADELGIERSELIDQLRGQTLASVITANGGDMNAISAAIVSALTERINEAVINGTLSQERADALIISLDGAVERALQSEGRLGRLQQGIERRRQGVGERFNGRLALINAAADAAGLTARALGDALRDGSSLGEVVMANGGDPDAVIAAALAQVTERLDALVADGNITQVQAEEMIEGLQAFYEAVMDGAFRTAENAVSA